MKSGNRPRLILQPRDRKLLDALRTFRFTTIEQARDIAGFGSSSRTRARLARLVSAGLLNGFHVGTIRGGRKTVYFLPGELRVRRRTHVLASSARELFI